MLVLNQSDIEKVFSMAQAIDADKDALSLYSKQLANIPLRSNIGVDKHSGQSLCMHGYAGGDNPALGVKLVSVYPNNAGKGLPNVPATMVVMDPETGIVSAVMDGTYLTQLRTGAVQGAATDILARKDASVGALIGAGGQAMMQLAAMLEVRKFEEIRIFSIDLSQSRAFVDEATQRFSERFTTRLIVTPTAKEALADADVITSVTTSKTPTFDFSDVKRNAHINGVGSYTPEMCELPKECIVNADRIIFDTMSGVMAEAGDFIQPLNEKLVSPGHYHGELGQVINQEIAGRENEEQLTVFKTVGSAVLDVVTAQRILLAAQASAIGTEVNV